MDTKITDQGAAVTEPKIKNPEMSLRGQLEMELLSTQNSRLLDQRNKLLEMVEQLQPENPIDIPTVETPVGCVKVGDVICYDRCNKQVRFGTVAGLVDGNRIKIHHAFTVKFGDDNKQTAYSMLNCTLDAWRVCDIL